MMLDASEFVGGLIGYAYDPAGLHCWELVRQCQRVVFGRELPPVLVAPERRRELFDIDLRIRTLERENISVDRLLYERRDQLQQQQRLLEARLQAMDKS